MSDERPTPPELFNAAAGAFRRGELPNAIALLRGGFFENLYIAPSLLGEEFHPQRIWHAGADAEPPAAREYAHRYGRLWQESSEALGLLSLVWNDPLVRAELKKFLNLSKNLLSARTPFERDDLQRERAVFLNPERLKRTGGEILARVERRGLQTPLPRPRLGLVLLAARDPSLTVEFYRRLLGVEPVTVARQAGGYAEFELGGIHLAIHGQDRTAPGDPYEIGPPPAVLGWGAIFIFRVAGFDRYYENAVAQGIAIVDRDLAAGGRRFFVVKDPSGYLLEITEENPKGLEVL